MTDLPAALVREAQTLQRLGRAAEAIEAYKRVVALWPGLADCWFNLGVLQRGQQLFQEALVSYQKALEHGVSSPEEAHLNRAVIYSDYLRQDGAAEQELLRALQLNPRYVPALLNLANLNEDLGRRPQASALYERILNLDPGCSEALSRYANLQPVREPPKLLIEKLDSALRSTQVAAERASLGFALGRLLDGQGDYSAAFAAYSAANQANRAGEARRYDPKAQEQLVEALLQTPMPALGPAERSAAFAAATDDSCPPSPQPIFICGMFRSGSTLTEQLLAGHAGVVPAGEWDLLPRLLASLGPLPQALRLLSAERAAALAASYVERLRKTFPGASHVTDKRLDNFLLLGAIKALFPNARIVHTTRNPLDNCLSIFFLHLDPSVSYAHDLMDIGHYYRQYRRLMAHWQSLFAADIFELNYDSFVQQPAAQGAKLCQFLGLQWDERCLSPESRQRAVKTASVWQVREPIYTRSSGRAVNYASQLGALRDYLSDLPAW